MIRIEQLNFAFGNRKLFHDLSFTIARGEIFSLIGPNGCGKSTLLRLLRGSLTPQSGEISWSDTPVSSIGKRQMALNVAVVPQTMYMDFPYSVREMVAMGRFPHRRGLLNLSSDTDHQAVDEAMAMADVTTFSDRAVTELSGGELQRVHVARALAQGAEVLFLDEAASHLDIDHRLELSELLVRLNRDQGTTIVQISHDLDIAAAVSDRIMLLNSNGSIVGLDTPDQVITAKKLAQTFRVNVKVDQNPYTGTPQILPLLNTRPHKLNSLRVHVICGGGSGSSLLRKLHLAQAQTSAGPLNRGDTDQVQAAALKIPCVVEQPFSYYSAQSLRESQELVQHCDALIITTNWWGEGNLGCLNIAEQAQKLGVSVYLLNPEHDDDHTENLAQQQKQRLLERGAEAIQGEDAVMNKLMQLSV